MQLYSSAETVAIQFLGSNEIVEAAVSPSRRANSRGGSLTQIFLQCPHLCNSYLPPSLCSFYFLPFSFFPRNHQGEHLPHECSSGVPITSPDVSGQDVKWRSRWLWLFKVNSFGLRFPAITVPLRRLLMNGSACNGLLGDVIWAIQACRCCLHCFSSLLCYLNLCREIWNMNAIFYWGS